MSIFISGWYLIYTRPRHEKKVSEYFLETGINYFLPTVKQLRTWCDRKKYIESPLFPSYIFVYIRNMDDFYNALKADGSLYYVKNGSIVSRISESIIDNIRILIDAGASIEVNTEYFKPSQQLMIQDGPFTGMSCEVVEFKGKEKILVRVHLLQRNVLATLPAKYMKAIPA
jgi:transcriptional antiterminator RfaH